MNDILKLTKYAISYLSKYESTKYNLSRILKNKIKRMNDNKDNRTILYNSIHKIIEDLEIKNLIDDNRFAQMKINSLCRQGKSEYYIKNILLKKGVNKEIINKFLTELDNNNSNWKLDAAEIYAKKRKLGKFGNTNNKQKDIEIMNRAGFEYSISKKILKYD